MKKFIFVVPAIALLFTACEKKDVPPPPNPSSYYTAEADSPPAESTATKPAASDLNLNPGDQADSYADRPWLKKIRQALSEDHTLSPNVSNVKIIISNGTIQLKGTVPDAQTKENIVKKVKQVVGDRKVEDKLEVAH